MSAPKLVLGAASVDARLRDGAIGLQRLAPSVVAAVRRALPFLARRNTELTAVPAAAALTSQLTTEIGPNGHVTRLRVDPSGAACLLILDATLVALLLDAVLGGTTPTPPALLGQGLTAPQCAVLARVVDTFLPCLATALGAESSHSFSRPPASVAPLVDATFVALTIRVGPDGVNGEITLALDPSAFAPRPAPASDEMGNPAIAAAVGEAMVVIVAELGRLRVSVGQLAALRIGDTLALEATLEGTVALSTGGVPIIRCKPTTTSGRIAVRVVGRHES